MKCKVVKTDAKLSLNAGLVCCKCLFFVDDTALLAECEGDMQRVVNEFFSVCKRRKLKVNDGKRKVMVFERRGEEVINFNTAYRVRLPAVASCGINLGSENTEEVSKLKYLGTVLSKHVGMEAEIRERVMKDRSVVGSLTGVMKGRNVSMAVKKV